MLHKVRQWPLTFKSTVVFITTQRNFNMNITLRFLKMLLHVSCGPQNLV